MSNDTQNPWMTAREAAKVLRVTERMIGHYANDEKIRTYREGRRVWYSREDVEKLAQALKTPLRAMQITAQDVNAEMIGYVRKREETDRQFLETQRELQEAQQAMLDTQSGLTQGQREMLERLERIEQQVKRGPTWQQVATIAVVALAIVVIAFLVIRAAGV